MSFFWRQNLHRFFGVVNCFTKMCPNTPLGSRVITQWNPFLFECSGFSRGFIVLHVFSMGPGVLVGWNNFTPLKDGEWKFSSPYGYIFFHPFLDIFGPLFFGGVANLYLEISPPWRPSRHHGMVVGTFGSKGDGLGLLATNAWREATKSLTCCEARHPQKARAFPCSCN